MADQEDRYVQMVAKLLELTQDSNLDWSPVRRTFESEGSWEKIVGAVFQARFADKIIRVYQREVDYGPYQSSLFVEDHMPNSYPSPQLGFFDKDGHTIFEIGFIPGLSDLYNAVSLKIADVDGFIDELLGKE